MGYRPGKILQVDWPVTIPVPADGGKWEDVRIRVTFQVMRRSEVDAFYQDIRQEPLRPEGMNDADWSKLQANHIKRLQAAQVIFLRKVVVGWPANAGIEDADRQPLPFSAEALDAMLDDVFVAKAMDAAYVEMVNGGARRGN